MVIYNTLRIPRNLEEIVRLCSIKHSTSLFDENVIESFNKLRQNKSSDLKDLKYFLDNHLSLYGDLNDETYEYKYGSILNTIITQLGLAENFEWFINKILNSTELMMDLVNNSYRHQNGFDKFVLMNSSYGWKLRLHVWWSDSYASFQENIHDHSWMFASTILIGQIYSDIFEDVDPKTDLAEQFKEYQYTSLSKPDENNFKMKYIKDTWLKKTESNVMIKAGQSYVFPPMMMHRILQPTSNDIKQNPSYGAVTFVLTAPRSRYTSRLINTCDTEYEEEQSAIRMTELEICQKLQYICQYLKNRSDINNIPLQTPI